MHVDTDAHMSELRNPMKTQKQKLAYIHKGQKVEKKKYTGLIL